MPVNDISFELRVTGLSAPLRAIEFDGTENVSQLFQFAVTVVSADELAFSSVVGKDATLAISLLGDEDTRTVHGIVSRLELLERGPRERIYRATLVPEVWRLQHRVDSRIFQELTAPQVIQRVLEGAGLASGDDFDISLRATYRQREYCVQYRESDWDFVSRLMEEEGIVYFFAQGADKHALTLIDAVSAYTAVSGNATLVYRPPYSGTVVQTFGTHVSRFVYSEEVRPGKVTLRDYNFEKPGLGLESSNQGESNADLEIYDYPGDYDLPADGATIAKTRLEELRATQTLADGDSTCAPLTAGYTFTLDEHPQESFNQSYLLTRVEHVGRESRAAAEESEDTLATYSNRFELVPASVLVRPPRVTRRPLIHGVQTAIVVGPSGEEIYVDAHARVKVQFHWDRLGKKDEKSSCWMRVSQPWASAAFGAVFIPRVNDEVVVTFLEGDPDRPLIVGSVYHGTNVPPYGLPAERTKSTIKSNTSTGGGGFNELRFEDKKGSEEVFLHGQKDWTIQIENDKNQTVGHDETLQVGNDRTKTVKHDQIATIQNDDTLTVEHDQTATIKHDQSLTVQNDRTVTVTNDHTETVSGKQTIAISKAQALTVGETQDITVTGKRTVTANDDVTHSFAKAFAQTVSGDASETVKGSSTQKVTGDGSVEIGGKSSLKISGDSIEEITGQKSIKVTAKITIDAGSGSGKITIAPSGEITISGVSITVDASGPLKVHGATVDVKSDGPATVKAPMVSIEADAVSKIKGAMVVLDGQMVSVG